MLFNKASAEFVASGNATKKVWLAWNEGYQMKEPGNNANQLFEDQKIRVAWGAEREEWYFSIVDVVGVLTDSPDHNTGQKYWNKLKQCPKEEGSEQVTNCHLLKCGTVAGMGRARREDCKWEMNPSSATEKFSETAVDGQHTSPTSTGRWQNI